VSPIRPCLRRAASATALVAASVLLASGLPGTASAQSVASARQDAQRLRAELAGLQERSAAAIVGLEQAEHELGLAIGKAAQLAGELDRARAEAGGTDRQLQRRVAALYKAGGSIGMYASLLQASDPSDFAARMVNVDKVVATDAVLRDRAQDGAGRVAVLEEQAAQAAAEKVRASGVAEQKAADIGILLAEQQAAIEQADARVRALVEQERREAAMRELQQLLAEQKARAAARMSLQPGVGSDPAASDDPYVGPAGACPVGPVHSFTDTWHANRSGGRKHQGSDVFAPYGSPAYAVVDGVVDKWSNGGLGGIALWLRADNGDRYYYAHNVSNVARVGQRVRAGQLVAYVGTTGNAATTPPHIHFEAHPGGGEARNPYPWLRALCG
jgi:murein DD-endopeptidase MepM/ murein hydrolase activator NlpD